MVLGFLKSSNTISGILKMNNIIPGFLKFSTTISGILIMNTIIPGLHKFSTTISGFHETVTKTANIDLRL